MTDAALQTTQYEYNARSFMTAVVDALNQRYTFTYDSVGHVTGASRGGTSMSFIYDDAGNRTQRTDYNGAVTLYAYDALNHLSTITYPDTSTVAYAYDGLSRLTSATNINGTATVGYDNRGRIGTTTDVWGQALNYVYDVNGNRTQMSIGSMVKANYQYDVVNRLTQLNDNAGAAVTYGYDDAGKLVSRTLPNGITSAYQYDGLNRLTRLTDATATQVVADNQYQYNDAAQITQQIDQGGTHAYAYDVVNRLTSATYPGTTNESYTYDGVGNRTQSHQSSSYAYQPFNRVVTIGSTSYGYDINGNLISKSDASGSWQYAWDYENRLSQVTRPDGVSISYKYDALGRRVQRSKSTGASTNYIYDGADVVKDINSDSSTVEYLNGAGIDNKIRQTSSTTGTHYFIQDHLSSTRALADTLGNVVETISYDSFGNSTGSTLTRYGYTGRERG